MGLNCLDVDTFCTVLENDPRPAFADKDPGTRLFDCGPYDPRTGQFLMHACYLGSSHPSGSGAMMLWHMLDAFPCSDFLVTTGIVGLAIFFITSSDSASQ